MGNNNSAMICPSLIAGRHRHSKKRGFTNKIRLFSSPKDSTPSLGKKKPLVITSASADPVPISASPQSQLTNDDARGLNRGRSLDLMRKEDVSNAPPFTVEQRALVKHSWHSVEEHIAEIGLTMYLEMFKKNPETLTLFPFLKHLSKEDLEFYSQLRNHAVRVTGVLTMLITQLALPPAEADVAMSTFLLELGRRHFSYASHPGQMELLGHTFVESLLPIFSKDDRESEIHEAWLAFFKLIVFYMQTGFRFVQNKGQLM